MQITTLPTPLTNLTSVRLHRERDRTDTPAVLPAVKISGQWHVDTGARQGRWYPAYVGTVPGGAEYTVTIDFLDLPQDPTLVTSPEVLAVETGMSLPLSDQTRNIALGAIRNAQADVVAYLGRSITPLTYVQAHVWPYGDTWDPNLTAHGDEDILRIISAEAEVTTEGQPTGYFTITYLAGLDGAFDPTLDPIRRYVAAHAVNSHTFTEQWRTVTKAKGYTKSVSAEGQSVSYDRPTLGGGGGKAGGGEPGSLPTIDSLDRWRVAGRRVHVATLRVTQWPYGTMR